MEVSNHPSKFFLAGEVKWCQALEDSKRYLVGVELHEGETEDFKLWQEVLASGDAAKLEKVREA